MSPFVSAHVSDAYLIIGLNNTLFNNNFVFIDIKFDLRYVISPVAVYDGCGSVAFVYWLRLKQYL